MGGGAIVSMSDLPPLLALLQAEQQPIPPLVTPAAVNGNLGMQARFMAFHEANPEVYRRLHQMALRLRQTGARRWSMKALFEALRWEQYLLTADPEGFKLNNNFTAYYARLMMQRDSLLEGFFETRERDG